MTKKLQTRVTPKLKLDPKNARRHGDKNRALIRRSLKEVGAGRGVLADADGIIRAGNGIFEAWTESGGKVKVVETDGDTLLVTQRKDLRGAKAIRAAMLDNLAADSSAHDYEAGILREIADSDALIAELVKEDDALTALLAAAEPKEETADAEPKVDQAEKLQTVWKTKSGQMWRIGLHWLLIGDCTDIANIQRLVRDEIILLLLSDPPYGINVVNPKTSENFRAAVGGAKPPTFGTVRAKGAYPFGGVKSPRATIGARGKVDATLYRPVHGDDKPFDPSHLFGLATHSILFGANYYASKLPDSRHWIVWDKNNTGTFADAELAWSDFETGVKMYRHTWNGMQREGERRFELRNRVHPNQKPVGLLSEIIKDHSERGDAVLDLYGGSGSVMVACENTERVCYMMEIDAAYGAVILQRMKDAFPQIEIELLSNGKQIAQNSEKAKQTRHKSRVAGESASA